LFDTSDEARGFTVEENYNFAVSDGAWVYANTFLEKANHVLKRRK
jgi:hypothetical protein